MVSPKPEIEPYSTNNARISKEFPLSVFRSSGEESKNYENLKNNNQISSVISGANSPIKDLAHPQNRRITEESMNYTDKSRSEELEELDDYKQAAIREYADQKKSFTTMQSNPFYIEQKRADIDPFKEFLNNCKSQLKSSAEYDDLQQMYDEETLFMNRISNLKEFRKLVQDYKNMGIKLNEDMSLDDDSLDDFKDGTLLCEIVSVMERSRIQNVTKNPKSKAS